MAFGGAFGSTAILLALFVLVISATAVVGREYSEFSSAPAPATMEAGSAASVAFSMAAVSAALLVSIAGIVFN